jgi:hypothetical protein
MDTQSYERTIHMLEGNDMTTLIVIAPIVFVLYCFMAEWNCSGRHSLVIVTILCRLVARHIKLGWKLFVGLIYFVFGMICIFEMYKKFKQPVGPEGGFTRFMDVITTPIQLLADGLVGLLGLLAIGVLFGLKAIKDSIVWHPHFWLGVVVSTYLLWLVVTICDLVEEEVVSSWTFAVSEDHGSEVAHRVLTRQDHITWSALIFVLWIAFLLSAPFAFGFAGHKIAIHASQASALLMDIPF